MFVENLKMSPVKVFTTLCALSLVAASPAFFTPFIHTDEGVWAFLGQFAFTGELYQQYTDHKPPLLLQLHWLLSAGETSQPLTRFLLSLWNALGAYVLYCAMKPRVGISAAFTSAIVVAVVNSLVGHGAFSAERLCLPFVMISLWAGLEFRKERRYRYSALVGLCTAALLSIKVPMVVLAVPAGLIIISSLSFYHGLTMVGLFGFVVAITHVASGVPFEIIWQEAYLINFRFLAHDPKIQLPMLSTNIQNATISLMGYLLPLTLGFCWVIVRDDIRKKVWSTTTWQDRLLFILLLFGGLSVVCVGNRYAQPYFVALIPALALVTAYAAQDVKIRRCLLIVCAVVGTVFVARTSWLLMQDRNKNWDAPIRDLAQNIERDTLAEDSIWISHALFGIYTATGRRPPMKHFIFHHMMGYLDPCRVQETAIAEDLDDPHYRETLQSLYRSPPKIIFWVQRNSNSCTDRIRLARFPTLFQWIQRNYELYSSTDLGLYFRLVK